MAVGMFLMQVFVGSIGLALHLSATALALAFMLGAWSVMGLGGALAVVLYRRRQRESVLNRGVGARLGLVAGLLGFFFYSLPYVLGLVLFDAGSAMREALGKAIEQAASQNPDPSAQEFARNLLSPSGLAAFITFLVVVFFLLFVMFTTLGGLLAASRTARRESPFGS